MSFLHPEFLWFLFALVIPILIHLFHFRNKKTVYFSSLHFLKEVNQSNRSLRKLKRYLILATRLLLFASLVFAFAQPIPSEQKNYSLQNQSIVFIYIDNSLSMQALGEKGELLSEAREIAKDYIESLDMNTKIVVHTNKISASEKKVLDKIESTIAIDNIDFIGNSAAMKNVIEWQNETIKSVFSEIENPISKRIFISDFQKHNLLDLPIYNAKDEFVLIKTLPEKSGNLTIDSAWFDIPVHTSGISNTLNFRICNFSAKPAENIELSLTINEEIKNATITIPANSHAIHSFEISEASTGTKKGVLSVNDNQLYWDDEFYFNYEVNKESKVLIVNCEDASSAIKKALATEKLIDIDEINIRQFSNQNLENKNLVVLNGINELSSGAREILKGFNELGGSVLIIPGENANLISLNEALSVLDLPTISAAQNNLLPITDINYQDPFFTGIFTTKKANITIKGVTKYYPSLLANKARSLISLRNEEAIVSYTTSGNVLFHFALTNNFGTVTTNDIFSTLLLRIAEISSNRIPMYTTIGDGKIVQVQRKENLASSLSLKNESLEFFPTTKISNSFAQFSLNGIEATENMVPGFFQCQGIGNNQWISVNYNRKESQTTSLTKKELVDKFNASGMKNIDFMEVDHTRPLDLNKSQKAEWWRYFLFLALGCILIEMLILKFMK